MSEIKLVEPPTPFDGKAMSEIKLASKLRLPLDNITPKKKNEGYDRIIKL